MALKDRLAALPVVGTAMAVQERYKLDAADQLAGAIGFFGFLSLVPLLLLTAAAAGFVYSDPDDQARVALQVTQALPGFEATLTAGDEDTGVADLVQAVVDNRGTITGVGLVALLVTGLKVVAAAMTATRVVFRGEVMTGIGARVRQLLTMAGLGAVALAAVAVSSIAATDVALLPRALSVVLALAVTFLLDLAMFLAAYRLLSPTSPVSARELLPGAVLAGAGWTLLKVFGATYVAGHVASANALYGTLGGVIALLLLLYLAGRLYLYGAELSAVLVERRRGPLWPSAGGAASPASEVAPDGEGPPSVPAAALTPPRASTSPALPAAQIRSTTGGRAPSEPGERGRDLRRTLAFGMAAAALAASWRLLGPGRRG